MKDIKFIHLITDKVTIAFKYADDDSAVMYSVAHCNPKDQYSRKIGRYITTNRLQKMEDNNMMDSIDSWVHEWGVIDTPTHLNYVAVKSYIINMLGINYEM